MADTLSQLLQKLYRMESAKRRGPCFVAVALALEAEIPARTLTPERLVQFFGKPDYWSYHAGNGLFVYHFDHFKRGRNRDEWYFAFQADRVMSSGYNRKGVNDWLHLNTRREWSPLDWRSSSQCP